MDRRTAALVLVAAFPSLALAATKHRVSGRVVMVSRICGGGAAITPEMEAQLPPPQPLAGKVLLVVPGEQIRPGSASARIETRSDGTFSIRLPKGTWCVFDASRQIPEPPKARPGDGPPPVVAAGDPSIDADCLAHEQRRCNEVLRVDKDVTNARIAFYESCSEAWNQPCYRGPMPP